jgi:hypothetical protein
MNEEDRQVLLWGGLAGIAGGLVFILVFIIVGAFAGVDPVDAEEAVEKFPDIRAARIAENSLYLLVLILWIVHFLALYRALRGVSLAPALCGSVLGLVGLTLLAAGALPHIATAQISDLYHAQDATAEEKATLVAAWQATQGIFDALFAAGMLVAPLGLIGLGAAMLKAPAFGNLLGRISVVLGVVGLVTAAVVLFDPASTVVAIGVFALIIFHLVVGWKVYGLSKMPVEA